MLRLLQARAGQLAIVCVALALVSVEGAGQDQPPRTTQPAAQAPQFVSPEVLPDRRVALRIYAPQAGAVRLAASDIPGVGRDTQLSKNDQGVWEITLGPIEAGSYRYNFNVDGVATIDPRNPAISESNNNVWSLVHVAGSDLFDTKDVPRGAVASVTYRSTALGKFRRMHVYTPPGYELGGARYPVFYLLHGAGDSDDSWSSVGRAGFILDNLIAARKALPMIVVMPAGHTSRGPGSAIGRAATEEFVSDFVTGVMPYIEKHYRVLTDRANTAIAGLSMGGGQTLHVAIPRLERFSYIGVYSSGLLGGFPIPETPGAASPAPVPAGPPSAPPLTAQEWEQLHSAKLDDPALKQGLRLLWFATGKEDRLMSTTQSTVDLFRKHGFAPVFKESPGGHTWINWRNYLAEFVPQLFQNGSTQNQTPNPADVQAMISALPGKAPASPKQPRRVLVLGRAAGFVHSSIPLAARTVEEMGRKTRAWSTTITYDAADINDQNLKQYDAIVLASTTGAFLDAASDVDATAARRKALLDFVRGGKGLAGIHAASDAYHRNSEPAWPEFNSLIGGIFKFHWNDGQTISVRLDEPNHPLNAAFNGRPLTVVDEIYTFARQPYSRENVRVLTSVDYAKMSAEDKAKERNPRTDGDYALSWIRHEGQGRVFYEALGHNEKVYAMKPILAHLLAGIQYVLGDLQADDRPLTKSSF